MVKKKREPTERFKSVRRVSNVCWQRLYPVQKNGELCVCVCVCVFLCSRAQNNERVYDVRHFMHDHIYSHTIIFTLITFYALVRCVSFFMKLFFLQGNKTKYAFCDGRGEAMICSLSFSSFFDLMLGQRILFGTFLSQLAIPHRRKPIYLANL